jgi:hypothetical protein
LRGRCTVQQQNQIVWKLVARLQQQKNCVWKLVTTLQGLHLKKNLAAAIVPQKPDEAIF